MGEQKHTSEPWHAFDSEYGGYCIQGSTRNGSIILPILGRTCNFPKQSEANARRIVACVNALAGIKTAEIEAGIVADMKALITEFATEGYHIGLLDKAKQIFARLERQS